MKVDRDFDDWIKETGARMESLASVYQGVDPFPHVVIDEFLNPTLAEEASAVSTRRPMLERSGPMRINPIWANFSPLKSNGLVSRRVSPRSGSIFKPPQSGR